MKESLAAGKCGDPAAGNNHCRRYSCKDARAMKLFPYIQENVDDIITVEDDELIVAFLDMVENHKMIVENSGLLTVAALKHMNVGEEESRFHFERR